MMIVVQCLVDLKAICYTKVMQKIASKVFIYSSIVFGVLGIALVISLPWDGGHSNNANLIISRLLMADIFIILPSFALSVAAKYLKDK